jgi:hypothetical protein
MAVYKCWNKHAEGGLKTSSLNMNRILVRMVMKDLLTLKDVKETRTVRK